MEHIINMDELEYGREVIYIPLGNGYYLGAHPIKTGGKHD